MNKRKLSIVIPTHNESENIIELHRRLFQTLSLINLDYEIIFVDDSTDDTANQISKVIQHDENVTLIKLTRSFGQATAISAGIDFSSGDAIIMMDADLQDAPELIPNFLELWKSGFLVVYAKRPSSGPIMYRLLARTFYKIQTIFSDTYIAENAGEFRLIDRRVADFLKLLPERGRYLRGQTLWPGFKSCAIEIQRNHRDAGVTKYNFFRSINVAIDGLISFSLKPLKIAIGLAIALIAMVSFIIIIWVILHFYSPGLFSPGWLSIMVAILGIGAMNLLVLGIIGEYIGKTFEQVQGRPRFIIDYIESRKT